jgi:hypothetical protein
MLFKGYAFKTEQRRLSTLYRNVIAFAIAVSEIAKAFHSVCPILNQIENESSNIFYNQGNNLLKWWVSLKIS